MQKVENLKKNEPETPQQKKAREQAEAFGKEMVQYAELRAKHLVKNFQMWSKITPLHPNIHPLNYCNKLTQWTCKRLASMQFIEGKLHQQLQVTQARLEGAIAQIKQIQGTETPKEAQKQSPEEEGESTEERPTEDNTSKHEEVKEASK